MHNLQWAPEEHLEAGQLNYEGYHRRKRDLGWVPWINLPEGEKDCWRAGAYEVFQKGWINRQRSPRRQQSF